MIPSIGDHADRGALPVPGQAGQQVSVTSANLDRRRSSAPHSPTHGPSKPGAGAFSFDELLKAFRYRWLSAMMVGLILGAGAATLMWFLSPAKYTAFAVLRVVATEPQLLGDARNAASDPNFENNQIALIKSKPIIDAALHRPGVSDLSILQKDDPAGWLLDEIRVAFLEKTDYLRIALSGNKPHELATLVNAVKDAYIEAGVNAQRNEKLNRLQKVTGAEGSYKEKLLTMQQTLRNIAISAKSIDPQALSIKQKSLLEKYAAVDKELSSVQAQIWTDEMKLSRLKAKLNLGEKLQVPDSEVAPFLEGHPLIKQKLEEVTRREKILRSSEKTTEPDSPFLLTSQKELKTAKDDLEKLRVELRSRIVNDVRTKMQSETKAKIEQSEESLDIAKKQREILEKKVNDISLEADRIGLATVQLQSQQGEVAQFEKMTKELGENKERLNVELKSTTERITILQSAETPEHKDYKPQIRAAASMGIAGLLLGVVGISFLESRKRRIGTLDEVANNMNLHVLGTLPDLAGARRGAAAAYGQQQSLLIESVDSVRAMLLCGTGTSEHRLLMVTSARAREGKTTLASHLALSMARCGKRTLLIDADLRRPTMHKLFDAPRGPGFAELLRKEIDLEKAIHAGPLETLSFMPAGNLTASAVPILSSEETRLLLQQLRDRYDFVIVDASPVLPVADALWLGRCMDGVIISIRPFLSRKPEVHEAYARFGAVGVPVLGTVVNGVRPTAAEGYPYYSLPDFPVLEKDTSESPSPA